MVPIGAEGLQTKRGRKNQCAITSTKKGVLALFMTPLLRLPPVPTNSGAERRERRRDREIGLGTASASAAA